MYFVYTTMLLGQPAGLSKEVCLYAGADWLSSSIYQPECVERSIVPLSVQMNVCDDSGVDILQCQFMHLYIPQIWFSHVPTIFTCAAEGRPSVIFVHV